MRASLYTYCNGGSAVEEVRPEQLLDAVVGAIELLAASGDEQIAWLQSKKVPMSELTAQFGDVYPIFRSRLSENFLIDDIDIQRLNGLESAIYDLEHSSEDGLFDDLRLLPESPRWEVVRSSAREALATLRRH